MMQSNIYLPTQTFFSLACLASVVETTEERFNLEKEKH